MCVLLARLWSIPHQNETFLAVAPFRRTRDAPFAKKSQRAGA
jgi:hypothetical protein